MQSQCLLGFKVAEPVNKASWLGESSTLPECWFGRVTAAEILPDLFRFRVSTYSGPFEADDILHEWMVVYTTDLATEDVPSSQSLVLP